MLLPLFSGSLIVAATYHYKKGREDKRISGKYWSKETSAYFERECPPENENNQDIEVETSDDTLSSSEELKVV